MRGLAPARGVTGDLALLVVWPDHPVSTPPRPGAGQSSMAGAGQFAISGPPF